MAKHFTKSRTMKFNAVASAIAITALPVLEANKEVIQATVPPYVYLLILIGMAAVNAWLRTKTDKGITFER